MPQVSVIIPVYNASRYLNECIDSILRQTFCEFELLLIDDGSKDDSGVICDEYAKKDSRIRVFHQANSGVSVARNVGLDKTNSEWIVFADADDIMSPNALEQFHKAAKDYNTDIIMGSTKVMIKNKISPLHVYQCSQHEKPLFSMGHAALWGYMIKTSVIKDNHIHFAPGLAYSEDKVFLTELALKSKTIASIPDYVYIYRRNEESVSYNKNGVMTSLHQFFAASLIQKISYKVTDGEIRALLMKKVKELIKAGCYDYASNSFSLRTYSKYERQYLDFFDKRWLLFYYTINAWMKYKRRSLITFRDNSLTGRKGLFSLLKLGN